jgi:hypothetical protein
LCFSEYKEKVNIVDHEDDDTVSFNLKNTWHFNQNGSGNLTGDEIVTVPHVLLLVRRLTLSLLASVGSGFLAAFDE